MGHITCEHHRYLESWSLCELILSDLIASRGRGAGLPPEFNVPKEVFEGRRDLRAHLMQYNDYMKVLKAFDTVKCKALSTTLRRSAKDWYLSLP
ncbi:hypothetical protein J1N35_033875 [Gossypium stocksii]|uniref:Retrotransposon gag domain-containing protein n=1 Tax=Gossypium stocksii TaxID=47602 RepID=A0A9D3ZQ09_9ROSI|nr:hypothetical protein J1N35_033875 [Gossypium stocksii]